MNKKKYVLGDHQKQGRKLIPPFLQFQNLKENSYVDNVIPNIIWLAILNRSFGLKDGTEIGLQVVKVISNTAKNKVKCFSLLSSLEILSFDEQDQILNQLQKLGILEDLICALECFVNLFPNSPISFINDRKQSVSQKQEWIKELKYILNDLYDKKGETSTFAMGNVLYHMVFLKKLKLEKGSPMAQLPRLIDYPNTHLSQMIASGIRSFIFSIMIEPLYFEENIWNKSFWDKCFSIEPLSI